MCELHKQAVSRSIVLGKARPGVLCVKRVNGLLRSEKGEGQESGMAPCVGIVEDE